LIGRRASLALFFADDRAEAKEQSRLGLCPITGLVAALRSVFTGALPSAYKQEDCTMSTLGDQRNFLRFVVTTAMLKNSERRIPPFFRPFDCQKTFTTSNRW